MSYREILSRKISVAQSKYEIVEKDVTQQSSYNLSIEVMNILKDNLAIKATTQDHYEISDDYKLILGDGIIKLIGRQYEDKDNNVIFIYTKSNDGTEKFQIKRKENKTDNFEWFYKLYDKNYEGSLFKVYIDSENKFLKFDVIPPVDVDAYEYELTDDSGSNKTVEYLSQKLKDYYNDISPKPTGIHLFGIDYCTTFEKNPQLEKEVIQKSGLGESYQKELHKGICIGKELRKRKTPNISASEHSINTELVGFNKIYYGIPGCGKSYKVDAMLKYKDGFKEEAARSGITSKVEEDNIIRTTFYLDYSNSDFVGQIYPVVGDDDKVTYASIPGPFTKALVRAYTHPNEMVYLIVEEINRGNAAAIFGDLFQLLDRVKETKDGKIKGESEYPISNEFIEGYLDKIIKEKIEVDGDKSRLPMLRNHNIIIPNNLTIFATMNTSDQNVFPLDTAFKRRWDLERVKVDWSKQDGKYKLPILNKCIPFTDMTWGNFASNINIKMVENCKDGIITQDKNLGPFFVDEDLLVETEDRYHPENEQKIIQFTNNVIDYLFLDVTKFNHDVLFEKNITYSEVYDYFTESLPNAIKGSEEAKRYLKIFDNNIEDDIIEKGNTKTVEADPVEAGDTTDGDSQER